LAFFGLGFFLAFAGPCVPPPFVIGRPRAGMHP
jgi:hypothetical protein